MAHRAIQSVLEGVPWGTRDVQKTTGETQWRNTLISLTQAGPWPTVRRHRRLVNVNTKQEGMTMIEALVDTALSLLIFGGCIVGFVTFLALVGIATKDHKGKGFDNEM